MKKYIYLAAALLSLSLASCEDVMDDINKKPDNPANEMINPALQLTDGIMSTGYSTVSGNLAWVASSLTEQLVGVGLNQFYNLEIRNVSQTASSSTCNNEWNSTYYNINNLKLALAKAEEGGLYPEYVDVRGMVKTLLALNYGILTDLFGDIPCSEATENTQPKVDKQQDVYTTIFSYLDGAIADLESAKADGVAFAGSQDILYNGDLDKWIAFAYALKARYNLHLMAVDQNAAANALAAAQKAKELGFDGAEITGFTSYASSNCNPWAAFWGDRNYNASSKTVADLMNERNDPRIDVYSTPWAYQGVVLATEVAVPGDLEDARTVYGNAEGQGFALPAWLNVYSFAEGEAASIHLMSKAELYFILAELEARNGSDYSEDFAAAVEASFADYGSFGVAVNGTAADYVASLSGRLSENALKEIMIQKYLSQCRDEQIETYNDFRRMEALGNAGDYVQKTNGYNTQGGNNRWPVRYPYGNSDVIANPNVADLYGDGMYVFTEKVWWAGGTR